MKYVIYNYNRGVMEEGRGGFKDKFHKITQWLWTQLLISLSEFSYLTYKKEANVTYLIGLLW